MTPIRAPWGVGFRDVAILAAEAVVKGHGDYRAAKTGDAAAAMALVRAVVSDAAMAAVGDLVGGHKPIVVSVYAQEEHGVNAIPEVLADLIAARLGLPTDDSVVQINVVNYTGADGFGRLARQALFDGDVAARAEYLIVDDFVGQGGTIANLRGFLERCHGRVVGAVALTGKPYSAKIALTVQRLDELRRRHGELEDWWRRRFGFGFDALTQSEARYLARTPDADTIRSRIAAAA